VPILNPDILQKERGYAKSGVYYLTIAARNLAVIFLAGAEIKDKSIDVRFFAATG
jgi:hypothetical protein